MMDNFEAMQKKLLTLVEAYAKIFKDLPHI